MTRTWARASARDAVRLEQANAALQHGKNLLTLATKAAGISSWEAGRRDPEDPLDGERDRVPQGGRHRSGSRYARMTHPEDASITSGAVRKAAAEGRDVCSFRVRVLPPGGVTSSPRRPRANLLRRAAQPDADSRRVAGRDRRSAPGRKDAASCNQSCAKRSRDAGMAEVATGVLHSVGNVLNSLGVSASLLQSRLRESRVGNVQRLAALLQAQSEGLGRFMEERRARPPDAHVSRAARREPERREPRSARRGGSHRENMSATSARSSRPSRRTPVRGGVTEPVERSRSSWTTPSPCTSRGRPRYLDPAPLRVGADVVVLDRHKLLQILGNLLANARHALRDKAEGPRVLTLQHPRARAEGWVIIEIRDTGRGNRSRTR